jgi:hypothetical protein
VRPATKNITIAYLRPFLATALIAGGLTNLAAPIYAAGTTAGTDISNTATASYEDPNAPGVPSYTLSNTVKVSVEKIAGIVVTGDNFADVTNAGKYLPGDIVNFDFKITNTGNSAVKFTIPGQATVSTAGDVQEVQWLAPGADPAVAANWKPIANGQVTDPSTMPVVPVDGFMKARVIVKIRSGANAPASGADLTVMLGKTNAVPTAANPSIPNVQQTAAPETPSTLDVYTADITNDPAVAAVGPAINSIRESAAFQTVKVSTVSKAFADINMTGSNPVPDPTAPTDVTKNKITYDITVKVNPNAPTTGPDAGKNPSDLGAAPILLDTGNGVPSSVNRVLISDPLPAGTVPTTLTAPTGWTPVYSVSPLNTPTDQIVWKTGVPPVDGTVKFVGFVTNDDKPLPMSNTPYSGFQVVVQTTGASTTQPTSYSNSADVYGTTPLTGGVADPANPVHDQTGTAAPDSPTGGTPVVTSTSPFVPINVFNGPVNQPEAYGVNGTQDTDFTNKSAEIKITDATVTDPVTGALTPLATPQPVAFSNTVENKGTTVTDIYLLPTVPAIASDLPSGTVVKLTANGDSRTYTYTVTAGVGSYAPLAVDAAKLPLVVPAVAANGGKASYGVAVTLPPSTPQLQGYSAPITAFADTTAPAAGATTVPTTATVSKNTTIDNVYTGYINLKKDARILDSTADASATETAKPFSTGTLTAKPKPGQFIQYRIKYNNITNGGGTNNGLLNAGKLNIVEDGTVAPNSWAAVTTHSAGSAIDSKGGKIIFFGGNGGNDNTDPSVSKYVVDMNATNVVVGPGESGNFTFLRQVK